MREGGYSSYCEVAQVLFVEVDISGKSCQNSQAIGVIPGRKDFVILLEKSRKQKFTNLTQVV